MKPGYLSDPDLGNGTPATLSRDQTILFATSNRGKLREMQSLFSAAGLQVALDPQYQSPREGEVSYADNAALKAHALHSARARNGQPQAVLADDSGLEVYALDGRPGVVTADYGGPAATWPERRSMLLRELAAKGSGDRRARFVCAMHYLDRDGREFASLGTVNGEIAQTERGELGFSFDPIFLYKPAGKTFAQLTDKQKNRVSHRAIAAAAIIAAIRAASAGLPA